MISLKAVIVHKIEKEANSLATVLTRNNLLPIGDAEVHFIDDVRRIYYEKSNPVYGIFNPEIHSYPFQQMVRDYLREQADFVQFTTKAVGHLKSVMDSASASTGGYVLFAHYHNQGEEFILTTMLNNKRQYNINDDLIIQAISSIDIDRLDVANLINIARWDEAKDTYLSFARGRKDISNYFKRFIGCTEETSAKQSSENFKRAVLDYLETLPIDNSSKEDLRNKVFNYCSEKIKKKEDIQLSHVSSIINEAEPESFKAYAAQEAYQVSAVVKGHRPTLKNLKFYIYRSKSFTIEFDSSLVADHTITYNRNQNVLTIKNIPDDLRNQFPEV